ncbi:VUT family protein [Micromonospora sp. MED01]|uniref:VUT family protein n=1 Tax=Micromonospora alfalfae TaxID=2911212 RepID=UPI001EE8DB32|nr:VUT family protein [Micromonospora alfalfae]MCG5464150.1 VUT family protein [Micromonospora alfalfae]
MTRTQRTALLGAAYIATIVAANLATAWVGVIGWPPVEVTAGTLAFGASFVFRDALHEVATKTFGKSRGRAAVFAAIAASSVISALLTYALTDHPQPWRIAAASGIGCLFAEGSDMRVFIWLRERTRAGAWILSNLVAAPIDSVLFLWIAGFPVGGWWAQTAVKFVIGLIVTGLYFLVEKPRKEVTSGDVLRDRLHRASA